MGSSSFSAAAGTISVFIYNAWGWAYLTASTYKEKGEYSGRSLPLKTSEHRARVFLSTRLKPASLKKDLIALKSHAVLWPGTPFALFVSV